MTIRREDLKKGQLVYVRVRGIMGDGTVKLRAAKVVDVLRAAVVLSAEGDDMPRTVRFNEIETKPPSPDGPLKTVPEAFAKLAPPQQPPQQPSAVRNPRRLPPVEVASAPPVPIADPAPLPVPAAPPTGMDVMNQWVQQGSGLLASMHAKQAALQAEIDAMALEVLRLEEEQKAKRAELERINGVISGLEKVRAAMEAA